ncbi:FAD-binding protein [Halobacillus fulvus]|nr:FAD-binding protein [Halobacillus fulvus]
MTSLIETDVLIIGAGPSGLMAANELQRRNIDFVCLEKSPERSDLSKALGIQARALELFELMDLHKPFLERGYPGPGAKLYLGEGKPSTIDLYHIKSRYPYMLVLPQNETEEILEKHLNAMGGTIDREHEVVEVMQSENGVFVKAKHNGEWKSYMCKYLLACDGSKSGVRQALNVEFVGEDEGYTFFLGDVEIPDMSEIYIDMHLNDRGAAAFFPYKDGSYRVVGWDRTQQGQPFRDAPSLQELQESLDRILEEKSYRVGNPKWLSFFGTAHRQVENYRKGRVFFVGDAAHIHNPLGGQGMNLGLEDASNLGWKLEAVLKGYAKDSFLDSYHDERSPVATSVLRVTSKEMRMIDLKGAQGRLRNAAGRTVLTQDWVQQLIANHLAHIPKDYDKTSKNKALKDSSASRKAIQAGERVPDQMLFYDGSTDERLYPFIERYGHVCLIYIDCQDDELIEFAYSFTKKAEAEYPGLLKVFLVAKGGTVDTNGEDLPIIYDVHRHLDKSLGMKKGSTLLIRPDGHAAFHDTSADPDQTMEKLRQFFHS